MDREKGDHYIMVKPGLARPIVIPKKNGLKEDIVLTVGRTLGLDRKAMEQRLNPKNRRKTVKTPVPVQEAVQPLKVDPQHPLE